MPTRIVIERILIFDLPLAFTNGGFVSSYGPRTHLNNLLIVCETHDGAQGLGEFAHLSGRPTDLVSDTKLQWLGQRLQPLIGMEANNAAAVRRALDLTGEGVVSGAGDGIPSNLAAAVDMAVHDLLGQSAGLPVWALLGGRHQSHVPEYASISRGTPGSMAALAKQARDDGFSVFQIKVGGKNIRQDEDAARLQAILDVIPTDATLLCDANGAWDPTMATEVMGNFSDPRILWEEPSATYADNRRIAETTGRPVILDQCVTGPAVAARACVDGAVVGMGLKTSVQGGFAAAITTRNLAVTHGLKLKVDDCWGADAVTAAALNLAVGVPPEQLICGIDMTAYFDAPYSTTRPHRAQGCAAPVDGAGLGLTFDPELLGPPRMTLTARQ